MTMYDNSMSKQAVGLVWFKNISTEYCLFKKLYLIKL
jgi:hypothetical protein